MTEAEMLQEIDDEEPGSVFSREEKKSASPEPPAVAPTEPKPVPVERDFGEAFEDFDQACKRMNGEAA